MAVVAHAETTLDKFINDTHRHLILDHVAQRPHHLFGLKDMRLSLRTSEILSARCWLKA